MSLADLRSFRVSVPKRHAKRRGWNGRRLAFEPLEVRTLLSGVSLASDSTEHKWNLRENHDDRFHECGPMLRPWDQDGNEAQGRWVGEHTYAVPWDEASIVGNADGSFHKIYERDSQVHMWTYIRMTQSTDDLSLEPASGGCDTFWVYVHDGLAKNKNFDRFDISFRDVPVSAGWNRLDLTAYHQHEPFSLRVGPLAEKEFVAQMDARPRDVVPDDPVVVVNEGERAANTGTFFAPDSDDYVLASEPGDVQQSGTEGGNWNWTYATTDGPTQSGRVTVSGSDGGEGTFELIVNNVAPEAEFSDNFTAGEGSKTTVVSFSEQSDPSHADTAAGFRYAYDFDNDGTFEIGGDGSYAAGVPQATATVPAEFLTDGPGQRAVKGRILDKDGGFADYTTTITIKNENPEATFSNDGPVDEGGTATVSFSNQFDPSRVDMAFGFSYAFDFNNDGAFEAGGESMTVPAALLADGPAELEVTGRILDKDGGYTDYTSVIAIPNVAPTGTFDGDCPVDGSTAATVSFSDQFDPSPVDTNAGLRYAYDFDNDGAFEIGGDGSYAEGVMEASTAVPATFWGDGRVTRVVRGRIVDKDGGFTDYTTRLTRSRVVGRHVFYNNSAFDENRPGADAADDHAIATDKLALLPGGVATFANYTSYSRGINGVTIDVEHLCNPAHVTVDDFEFRFGNNNAPSTWESAPAPIRVRVREGDGIDNSDRITIIWADNAIAKQWLEVTVLSSELWLVEDDVFYFGNAVAEAGNSTENTYVTVTDLLLARNNPHGLLDPAPVDDPYDYNRDKQVNPTDVLLARNNTTNFLSALKLIDLSNPGEGQASEADLSWISQLEQTEIGGDSHIDDAPNDKTVDMLFATYWP